VQDARGVSDFEALQVALRSQPSRLIFYAFDLLHLDGKDLFFGWRVLCTAKTLGFHFCRSELTRFAVSRLPSAYSINSWLT
jgi:hypothetical protein